MFSHHQLLFISLTRSIRMKPGLGEVVRRDMITSHMRRAGSVRRSCRRPGRRRRRRSCSCVGHSRQTTCCGVVEVDARPRLPCCVIGNASGQSPSACTACMNSSVISSDRLNWRSRPSSRLARMKSIASGCADVERAHLRAAPAAGGRHGEAHLVVDIHERQRAGRVRAGAGDVRAARAQRRELVADAAAGLQRQPGLVDLVEDVVHRVVDRAGHGAVDRRGRGLVLQRAGVRGDAAGRESRRGAAPRGSARTSLAHVLGASTSASAGDALVGAVDVGDRSASPSLAFRRYFLSQISSEASWKGMLLTSHGLKLNWNAVLHAAIDSPRFDRAVPTSTPARAPGLGARSACRDSPPDRLSGCAPAMTVCGRARSLFRTIAKHNILCQGSKTMPARRVAVKKSS